MSSYLPPTSDLPSFNSQIFQSNLSADEVDSKIKSLETTRKTYSMETGVVTENTASGSVTFDEAYDSAPVVVVQGNNSSTSIGFVINISSVTTTGFNYRKFKVDSSDNSVGEAIHVDWNWIAIGERS